MDRPAVLIVPVVEMIKEVREKKGQNVACLRGFRNFYLGSGVKSIPHYLIDILNYTGAPRG
jgi:hypothetical protein